VLYAAESRTADFPVEYISSGAVMENVVTGDDVNLTIFPTPTWHKLDPSLTERSP
jgi:3-polyprenyl-4-hydroxybenzoate decarboxylase